MLLEVKDLNISLTSGKSVAEHISFRLGQGEMLSIVGSSGAGKTTICKAIMGLLGNAYRADGEILFQAENLLNLPERKRQAIYGKEICLIMQNLHSSGASVGKDLFAPSRKNAEAGNAASICWHLAEAGAGRYPADFEQLSLYTVWRNAPAADDCGGADVPAIPLGSG